MYFNNLKNKIFTMFNCFIILLFFTSCIESLKSYGVTPSDPSIGEDGYQETVESSFAQFKDIPIPESSLMNVEKTLLLGERETWIGRLVMTNSLGPAKVFDFFKSRLGSFGWQEITTVRSTTSILSYSLVNRIMTIQIEPHKYNQSLINITMSPRLIPVKDIVTEQFDVQKEIIIENDLIKN